MKKKSTFVAYLCIIAYALAVGLSFLFVKKSTGIATPLQTMTFRFCTGFIPYLILLAIGKLRISLKGVKKGPIFVMALTYASFLGFQAFGLVYTTSIVSGILFAMVPIFARIVGGIVLKEKTTWLQNIFMCLSVGSVVALFLIGSKDALTNIHPWGFVLLILCSLSCAVSNVYMRRVRMDFTPLQVGFMSCFAGVVLYVSSSLVVNTVQGSWDTFFLPLTNPDFLGPILYLGIMCTFFSGLMLSYSLSRLPAVNATIWGNVSTAISVVAGAIFLHEPLFPYQIVCTLLIICGVLGISFFQKPIHLRKKKKEA